MAVAKPPDTKNERPKGRKGNIMYQEYIRRRIVRETEKAYMVEQTVNNRRDGWHTNFKWVAKKCCKGRENDTVLVPEWLVSNGVW